MKIQLKKAITHKGNELTTLDLELDNLTGNDLIDVEDQILKTGNPIQSTDFSRVYLITVAARALHMPVEILKQMCARDFARVVNEVRNFLTASDSDEENHPEESSGESVSENGNETVRDSGNEPGDETRILQEAGNPQGQAACQAH